MMPMPGPLPFAWRRNRRWRRHGPPPFVRYIGCAFAMLIVMTAIASGALVAMFAHVSPGGLAMAIAAAVAAFVAIVIGFTVAVRKLGRHYRKQDELRRQLMADVAHELRTPLSVLQGRVEGMLDGVYPRDDAAVSALLNETHHLSRLVEDVRTVANAEAGALELRKEPVDLGELIREAAAAIASNVTLRIPDDLPQLDADPVRIREVLLNLLTNAEAAGAAITVSARATSRGIEIRVHDDGPGIAPEELPHVFDRFRKGRDSRGTGLGLSIAQRLVVAHGGRIDIESEAGRGTTATVTLPR